jgi:hypothetical protein
MLLAEYRYLVLMCKNKNAKIFPFFLKGIVQRILSGVDTMLK